MFYETWIYDNVKNRTIDINDRSRPNFQLVAA